MENAGRDKLQSELLNAIKNHELILYYQPQYNLFTTKFEGVEALVRWHHPGRGLLLPEHFIPVAEESDLISRIGEWVLKSACSQLSAWMKKGLQPMRMAVNVAGRQLQQKNFVGLVEKTLHDFALKPDLLELEINEKVIIRQEDKQVIQTLNRLHAMGVKIALDDFGTGFTSIGNLKKLPIDTIKIDRTFINNISINQEDAAIVRALITLAHSLNLQVIAEGVETLKQLQSLSSKKSIGIQGFYISEALPVEELEKFLQLYQNR